VPEVSDQVELGMERHRPRSTLQLTPFLRWTRDPIRQLKAATASGGATTTLENLTRTRAVGADGSVRARPTDGTVVTLAGSVAHMETTADVFGSSGVYATARLTVDVRVAEHTTAQLYAYRRSAQAIEQGEILPAFTSELALTQRLAGDRARVTLRLTDPLRGDRLDFRDRRRDLHAGEPPAHGPAAAVAVRVLRGGWRAARRCTPPGRRVPPGSSDAVGDVSGRCPRRRGSSSPGVGCAARRGRVLRPRRTRGGTRPRPLAARPRQPVGTVEPVGPHGALRDVRAPGLDGRDDRVVLLEGRLEARPVEPAVEVLVPIEVRAQPVQQQAEARPGEPVLSSS
jgi:hypothetical protein